jgi:O-antigen/teichoic acid export membrane protein
MKLTQNILTTLSARVVLLVLALVSSVVLARMLGPEGRGLFALVLLLPEWGRSLGLLGFDQANAVYAGLEPGGRKALVWQSAAVAVVVGGIIAVAGMGFLALGAPGSQTLIRGPLWLYLLPLATVPGRLAVEYWGAILRGMNRIYMLNVVQVGMRAASLVLVLLFVGWFRLDVAGAVWADSLVNVAVVFLMIILLAHVSVWGRPSFSRSLLERTTKFALPAHGGTIAAYLNYRVDEFMIAALLPPEQLGFYVIAVGLVERLWILPGSVATALLPHLTNSRERDPALSAEIARHVMVWTGAACLLVFLLADVVVRMLYSPTFATAAAPLRWLLPGIFTLSIGKVLVAELLAQEKPRYTVWASGMAALVNVAGNLALVPHLGVSGAALASSLSYTLLSFILVWYYLRETGVSWTALVPRPSDLMAYAVLWNRPTDRVLMRNSSPGGVWP